MNADNPEQENTEPEQKKKRSPLYYGASGCALGFLIMVGIVMVISLLGSKITISGKAFSTFLTVGSWVVPIGLGVLGYFYGKSKQ